MAQRKNWTEEQKAEILKKAKETSVMAASKEFGVAWATISAWKKKTEVAAVEIEVKKNARKASRKVSTAICIPTSSRKWPGY